VICFVLFLHFFSARTALTCSGSSMSHSFAILFSSLTALIIVPSAFPSFFICHACSKIFGRFRCILVCSPKPASGFHGICIFLTRITSNGTFSFFATT